MSARSSSACIDLHRFRLVERSDRTGRLPRGRGYPYACTRPTCYARFSRALFWLSALADETPRELRTPVTVLKDSDKDGTNRRLQRGCCGSRLHHRHGIDETRPRD